MNHVITALPNERTLRIPIKLSNGTQIVKTTTLVDCGATRNFIDIGLLCLLELPLEKLPKPIIANNIDGTTNAKGTIRWKAHTNVLFKERTERLKLMVLSLRRRQIILGMPWLKKWNPAIDWKRNMMTIPETPLTTETTSVPQQYLVHWLGIDADTKINKHLRKHKLWKENESINKITISIQIAQQSAPSEISVPDWCTDFSDVFSEQTHAKLPPHHHYNHTIDLQPTFTPHIAKIYPLNPAELQTCKEFIDEHLKTGWIIPSKSPQASLFFFVPKKDGSLRPCQDYRYCNSHTIRNVHPLPLIPELIDNMKDATLFTKFDIRWGYNNIRIHEEDQWKAAFITPLGLFEPTVMFFGFCNAPSTFQAFMNHIFADMIAEKWLKIYMDNIGIHTKDDLTLHHERTRRVLLPLQEHGLSLKISKCIFDAP